jgi:hypothetical protein
MQTMRESSVDLVIYAKQKITNKVPFPKLTCFNIH